MTQDSDQTRYSPRTITITLTWRNRTCTTCFRIVPLPQFDSTTHLSNPKGLTSHVSRLTSHVSRRYSFWIITSSQYPSHPPTLPSSHPHDTTLAAPRNTQILPSIQYTPCVQILQLEMAKNALHCHCFQSRDGDTARSSCTSNHTDIKDTPRQASPDRPRAAAVRSDFLTLHVGEKSRARKRPVSARSE